MSTLVQDELKTFRGTAPLFPLDSVALLPHAVQALHIFEPRYRAMTAAALNGDRLLALAVLKPGWAVHHLQKDVPICSTACLGRIAVDERLADGRYMLVVRGLCRVRVVSEVEASCAYRVGRLELLPDRSPEPPAIDRQRRRDELLQIFHRLHPGLGETPAFMELLQSELPLGELCDVLAFGSLLSHAAALSVLEETNVDARSDIVLRELKRAWRARIAGESDAFPPRFSDN